MTEDTIFEDEDYDDLEWERTGSGDYNDIFLFTEEEKEGNVEEGDEFVGRYEGIVELGEKAVPNHKLANDDKGVDYMFSRGAVLDEELDEVPEGVPVKIVYNGMVESEKGREYRQFEVYTAK